MQHNNDIEHLLERETPTLSQSERDVLWNSLTSKLGPQAPIPSPFVLFNFSLRNTKTMTSLLLVLLLVLGGSGTALASDAARPGDLLFPVERALENTRIRLAQSDESRSELKNRYADERLTELREILNEESTDVPNNEQLGTTNQDTTSNEDPSTSHKNKDKRLKESGEARVAVAVDAIFGFLDDSDMDEATRVRVLKSIFGEIDGLALNVHIDDDRGDTDDERERVEVRRDDRGESRVEVRDEEVRIRVEEKNGTVRVQTKKNDDDSDDWNDDASQSSDNSIDTAFEAEADVFTDTTIIKIEWNDEKTIIETNARTKEDILTEILKQFNVSRATVENVLQLQMENRASRPEDSNVSGEENDEEDDTDADLDDDESDDEDEDFEDDTDDNEDERGDRRGRDSDTEDDDENESEDD